MCVKLSVDSGVNSSLASTSDSGRATPVISVSQKYDEVKRVFNLASSRQTFCYHCVIFAIEFRRPDIYFQCMNEKAFQSLGVGGARGTHTMMQ